LLRVLNVAAEAATSYRNGASCRDHSRARLRRCVDFLVAGRARPSFARTDWSDAPTVFSVA